MQDPTWGLVEPELLPRIVVVSPHLDDAVLGTSHLLLRHPGSTVVTVFAGRPPRYPEPPGPWDAAGGLRATPIWLDFVEQQYLPPSDRASADDVAKTLSETIRSAEASSVFLPMG